MNGSDLVNLFCVHPRPPRPGESSSLQRDAELIKIAQKVKSPINRPALIIGDLNDVAWSHTTRLFKRLSNTLDPRVVRGLFITFFPASNKFFSFPLDHAFHTKELVLRELKVLNDIGSDHLPILISFNIEDNKSMKVSKTADSSDKSEANKTIQESKNWDGPIKEVDI